MYYLKVIELQNYEDVEKYIKYFDKKNGRVFYSKSVYNAQCYLSFEEMQKEFNELSEKIMFFAFSEEQFDEGLAKFGITRENMKDKILRVGSIGGYLLKDKEHELDAMFEKQRNELKHELDKDKTGKGFIRQMFDYELANHEYGYTGSLEETLDAVGLTAKSIEENKALQKGLKLALAKYN